MFDPGACVSRSQPCCIVAVTGNANEDAYLAPSDGELLDPDRSPRWTSAGLHS